MAYEMKIRGTQEEVKVRSLWAVALLPIGVALAVGVAGLLRALAGDHGWWRDAGGFVLLALVLVALLAAARGPTSRR